MNIGILYPRQIRHVAPCVLLVGLSLAPHPVARGQGVSVTKIGGTSTSSGTLTLGNGFLNEGSVLLPNGTAGTAIPVFYQLARVGPPFFTGELPLATSGDSTKYLTFPNGSVFGHHTYLGDTRYIYHFDMGFEHVIGAADGRNGVYFYDFQSGDFFHTSPTLSFP